MVQFVKFILPVHSDPDFAIKENIIRKVCAARAIYPLIPSYPENMAQFSLPDLIAEIEKSALVLVDLTNSRPSCYYELGIAEAIGANIRLIARNGTEIHQTSHREHVSFYQTFEDFDALVSATLTALT